MEAINPATGEQISTYEEHTDKEIGRTLETAVETFHAVVRNYFRAVHHISASQPPKLGICDGPAVKSHARPYEGGASWFTDALCRNYHVPVGSAVSTGVPSE